MVDYYKEACRALENSETASMLGKIQKDWKKLVQMKIYYFASIAHVSHRGGRETRREMRRGPGGWRDGQRRGGGTDGRTGVKAGTEREQMQICVHTPMVIFFFFYISTPISTLLSSTWENKRRNSRSMERG